MWTKCLPRDTIQPMEYTLRNSNEIICKHRKLPLQVPGKVFGESGQSVKYAQRGCFSKYCTHNYRILLTSVFLFFQVFLEYFKELEEESIRDNFVLIYELLDEVMDFGFPQTTDSKILQEYALSNI